MNLALCYLVPENGSTSAPPCTASVSAGQQSVDISIGKEVVVNGENGLNEGNEKQNSGHEDIDLQEWYKTCFCLE